MKAVITADIVNSTKIEETNRYLLVDELVAIHCLVYNHEPYLCDCLERFLL